MASLNVDGKSIGWKPRYTVRECLALLSESRERFYQKVRSGRYCITKDGKRTYMTHDQLLDAAKGDRQSDESSLERKSDARNSLQRESKRSIRGSQWSER